MPQRETDEMEVQTPGGVTFTMTPTWVTAALEFGLSFGAFALYGVLLSFANNGTRASRPTRATLARKLSRTVRAVEGYLAELEAAGYVQVTRRPQPDGRHRPNVYVLPFAEPVDNPYRAPAAPDAEGEGEEFFAQPNTRKSGGEGEEDFAHLGEEDFARTRLKKELDVKEMSDGPAAPTSRAEAEPVENPAPAKAGPTVAADFEAWWSAFRAGTNAPTGPKKTAASVYATARRNGATAAELLDGLAAFRAGLDRDNRAANFNRNWPHAVTWLRQERWTEYPPSGADAPAGSPEAARTSSEAFRRAEAVRGPYSLPELPADLSPDEYRLRVAADRSEFLAGNGRWESPTP